MTLIYVRNIYKYYVAYKLALEEAKLSQRQLPLLASLDEPTMPRRSNEVRRIFRLHSQQSPVAAPGRKA